jgi:thioredoxin reductase
MLDVAIIGGSSAGLSAALVLGRSLRRVTVFDDGKPCNRFSHASHGFLTQDGTRPADLLQVARDQLQLYPTVSFMNATVTTIQKTADGFVVTDADGAAVEARNVLLATGVKDELPALPGMADLWGRGVFHCPYCDGYEVRQQPLVVYGTQETALHQVTMLRQWSDQLTLCTGAAWELDADQRARLTQLGIQIIEEPLTGIERGAASHLTLHLQGGTTVTCTALFIRPTIAHRTPFAMDFGCQLTEHGLIQVDLLGHTTVARVYAAGDITTPVRSVAVAVAQGAAAGYGINNDLVFAEFG